MLNFSFKSQRYLGSNLGSKHRFGLCFSAVHLLFNLKKLLSVKGYGDKKGKKPKNNRNKVNVYFICR